MLDDDGVVITGDAIATLNVLTREQGPQLMPDQLNGDPARTRQSLDVREDFQQVMQHRYTQTIKQLTGRNVVAFLSQAHVEPDITVEMFFIDGPLPGFGAVEITEPELINPE